MFLTETCSAVGVTDNNTIPDDRMKVSSRINSSYSPYYGRLNVNRGGGAWYISESDASKFLEVVMGAVHTVCRVATQGEGPLVIGAWTKNFTLNLSEDGSNWTTSKNNGNDTVST